jgi:processing peptidase subunit beta
VNHESFVASVDSHFKNAPTEAPGTFTRPNTEKPYFTGSTLYMRDDEMANLNIGVFFEAPNFGEADYFGM